MGDLRNAIGRAEAGKDGYDAHYGIGIRGYAQSNKRISQMSVAEVREFQRAMKANAANKGNAPVGRYQFVPTTLEPLLRKLGIPDTATFDAALQDRLADALLVRRGVDRFRNGEIDARTFQDNLSQEWATIAKPGRATPHRDDIHPDPAPIQAPQIQAVISGASSYRW